MLSTDPDHCGRDSKSIRNGLLENRISLPDAAGLFVSEYWQLWPKVWQQGASKGIRDDAIVDCMDCMERSSGESRAGSVSVFVRSLRE